MKPYMHVRKPVRREKENTVVMEIENLVTRLKEGTSYKGSVARMQDSYPLSTIILHVAKASRTMVRAYE